MRSFIIKTIDFFKLNTGIPDANFNQGKRKLRIPLYQREYKWANEKISALANDINHRDKFLGNIILDEAGDCYEIVDGQQRITSCYLTLLCLYNYYEGSPLEQSSIRGLLKPYGDQYVLNNDSIGSYITENGNRLEIQILDESDVYFQKEDFIRAYDTIHSVVNSLGDQALVREFKRKLLDSELLVLINEQHNNTRSIEQIFLDINEKAQLLEVEDIFKGHCFENHEEAFHNDLRNIWVDLKKCGMGFKPLGFSNLSQYIYLFLLENDNSNIPENLSPGGKHYLEGKTMDETRSILMNLINFGKSILNFHQNLSNNGYRFIDLCPNSTEYRNTSDHIALKKMSLEILDSSKAQYQKLPLMYFIYRVAENSILQAEIRHDLFKRIITNLYIYSSLFIIRGGRKSKQDIDHTVRDALNQSEQQIDKVVQAVKQLRVEQVEEFSFMANAKYEDISFIYSVIDLYVSNSNWLPQVYSRDIGFNLEHLVIPDNRARKICWYDGAQSFEIYLERDVVLANKKKTVNFLVLDENLNGNLESYDIITKISMISEWYEARDIHIPQHIAVFIQNIESLQEYQNLCALKVNRSDQETIKVTYVSFLNVYFSEENQQSLLTKLRDKFILAFQNHN